MSDSSSNGKKSRKKDRPASVLFEIQEPHSPGTRLPGSFSSSSSSSSFSSSSSSELAPPLPSAAGKPAREEGQPAEKKKTSRNIRDSFDFSKLNLPFSKRKSAKSPPGSSVVASPDPEQDLSSDTTSSCGPSDSSPPPLRCASSDLFTEGGKLAASCSSQHLPLPVITTTVVRPRSSSGAGAIGAAGGPGGTRGTAGTAAGTAGSGENHGQLQSLKVLLSSKNLRQHSSQPPVGSFRPGSVTAPPPHIAHTQHLANPHLAHSPHNPHNDQWMSSAFALDLRSMDDFFRAVGLSHWINFERELEQEWLTLLNRAFRLINMNSVKFSEYDANGPRTETCRRGLTTVQPWSHNRVALDPAFSTIAEDPDPTFVNASPMPSRFIAAGIPQSPAGREAFWTCCFQHRVKQIVMLNLPGEQDNVPYWPHSVVRTSFRDAVDEPVRYGNFVVTLLEVIGRQRPEILHRRFRVDYAPQDPTTAPALKKATTIIEHHHYTDWRDMSVPESKPKFIAFLEDVLRLRTLHSRPVLVHCFGGAGRTGSFICIAHMLFGLDFWKRGLVSAAPNLIDTILELRRHRQDQVQTQDQYKFCHRIIYGYVFPDPHSIHSLEEMTAKELGNSINSDEEAVFLE